MQECFINCNSHLANMKLTIPREPVLETSRRAKNFRAHRSGFFFFSPMLTSQAIQLISHRQEVLENDILFIYLFFRSNHSDGKETTSTFKALPLNRKVKFEAFKEGFLIVMHHLIFMPLTSQRCRFLKLPHCLSLRRVHLSCLNFR